ncbi:MAG: SGNH/GDSL hydrolase family protein [Clostridia bacterium]|nr:SGNH/GDSL hydrolase family protein [Clostridia bacterium]
MINIAEIDSNLKVETAIDEPDIKFLDVRTDPFQVYGLFNHKEEPVFKRMPDDVAEAASEAAARLNLHTAGGRARFTTDSQYVAIKAAMPYVIKFPHMPLSGTSGFDLFIDEGSSSTYYGTFMPPVGMSGGYESILHFDKPAERKLTINFPLYNPLNSLYIGLQSSAHIGSGAEYAYKKPVLYYGSSITQGGCACRPGNSYQAIISRRFNCDHINLGFSGSAKGEDAIVDYMSELDVSVFVCDYDHNAPTVEHLAATHEKMFKKFRMKSPELPIILVSKPGFESNPALSILKRDVIYTTYMNAIRNGDQNVYYIDGQHLFKDENRDCCTVDGVHPNDAGFLRMAEVIGHTVGRLLR